jgi:phosphopantetheinyl transferase
MNIKILIVKVKPNDWENFKHLLDDNDINRMSAALSDRRKSIICASAILKRYYLASLLNVTIDKIKIDKTAQGKPYITIINNVNAPSEQKLYFSISHSENYVAIATNSMYEIGIDLQIVKHTPLINNPKLLFSNTEKQLIVNSPQDKKSANFFILWTKKESYLKALGSGINDRNVVNHSQLDLELTEIKADYIISVYNLSDKLLDELAQYYLAICVLMKGPDCNAKSNRSLPSL